MQVLLQVLPYGGDDADAGDQYALCQKWSFLIGGAKIANSISSQ
jgi:hypothetical protein